ncbi:Leucine-rich repeat domain superfamily [Sesbania bispinosa]|nr:Leucine-rich repeat domain superfamily [Sesbania bispinosa]
MTSCSRPSSESTIMMKPNWLELPRELTANILQRLGAIEIVTSVRRVCPLWWDICKDPLIWRVIDMGKKEASHYQYDLNKICRYAVERSCGHLEDINIEYFATNDLLNYIADRYIQKGLCQVAKKLPLLEELDITCFNIVSEDTFKAIGQCCPLLKVLKLDSRMCYLVKCDDDVALAIAKTMSKLCHLQICGIKLSDVGLSAILDGCPLLESLDLRRCIYFELLDESLEKRCREQIKYLLFPYMSDYGCSNGDD